MENIRVEKCNINDLDKAIDLINYIFRTSKGFEPTMEKEFPLLLSKNNINNIHIVKKKNKLISVVSYLPSTVYIQGFDIKVASVGAVCTHPYYRNFGISSLILDEVEDKMFNESIDIMLVSGTRSLYKRRDCVEIKSMEEYIILPENLNLDFNLKGYSDKYLDDLIYLYNLNNTRYYRNRNTFKNLLTTTIDWGDICYDKFLLEKNKNIIGYIILKTFNDNTNTAYVMEACGDKTKIYKALKKIAYLKHLNKISYSVHIKDSFNKLDKYDKKNLANNGNIFGSTCKVLNFTGLIEKLKPYFSQYVDADILDKLSFGFNDNYYFIRYDKEILKLNNLGEVTKIILEGGNFKGEIGKFINLVFPIPFVWTENLNFQ